MQEVGLLSAHLPSEFRGTKQGHVTGHISGWWTRKPGPRTLLDTQCVASDSLAPNVFLDCKMGRWSLPCVPVRLSGGPGDLREFPL